MKKLLLIFSTLFFFVSNDVLAGGGSTTYSAKGVANATTGGSVYAGYVTSGAAQPAAGTYASTSTAAPSSTSSATTYDFYFFARANSEYNFLGWSATQSGDIESSANPYKVTLTSTTSTATKTLYARFAAKTTVTLTLEASTGGTYTASDGTITVTSPNTLTTKEAVTLTATPASGYKVYRWYTQKGSTKTYFSLLSNSTNLTAMEDVTVGVEFIPADTPVFQIKGITSTSYTNLNDAITAAGSKGIIVVVGNGTVPAGNYTIPSGVTLLVPYDAAYTVPTMQPNTLASYTALSLYRKLKLADGANITVNGSICVGGQQSYAGQNLANSSAPGCPTGAYGCLDMSEGGHITLNSGANLYAWGFITGQNKNQGNNTSGVGTIEALSGSKVYEDFIMGIWRGGSATSDMLNNSQKVFPMNQYFVPNIEVPLTINYGATETVFTSVNMSLVGLQEVSVTFIASSGGFFKLNAGSTITKWYDATTDYMCVKTTGSCEVSSITVSISGASMNSAKYVLPIAPGLDITVASGTLNMGYDLAIFPGARLKVASGATANISANMYMYDLDDWDKWAYGFYYCSYKYRPTPHYPRTTVNEKTELADAKLDVCGTLNISGKLYSTTNGANICSTGAGQIVFSTAPTASTTTYQAVQVEKSVTYASIPCVAPWLQNADGTHVTTAGTAANTTYYYYRGAWTTTMPTTVEGDVDGDGEFTTSDVDAIANIIVGKDPDKTLYNHDVADMDGNGNVNLIDLTLLVNLLKGK